MEQILSVLRKSIIALEASLTNAANQKIDLSSYTSSARITVLDYKKQRARSYLDNLRTSMTLTKKAVSALEEYQKQNLLREEDIIFLRDSLASFEEKLRMNSPKEAADMLSKIKETLSKSSVSRFEEIDFVLPRLPAEIASEVTEDLRELERCYTAGCYRSSIILCGRVLETTLHRRYYEHTNNDLLETSPGTGLGKIIAKMSEANIPVPVGLNEQIHLINNVRIMSVHKKKLPFSPSKEQTQAIILFTMHAVKSLFR